LLLQKAPMPSVSETLSLFVRKTLPRLLGVSFVVSLLPLPRDYVLGNGGEVFFALLTPLILLLVTGLVIASWWAIRTFTFPIIRVLALRNFARRRKRKDYYYSRIDRNTVLSMLFIALLVIVVLPWQVAFLGCWVIHLVTCATTTSHTTSGEEATTPPRSLSPSTSSQAQQGSSRHHEASHVLLLLTWLLPLAAPVLAVWVRTLATAGPIALDGIGTGDHNFLSVAPYLILVEEYAAATWTSTRDSPLFLPPRSKKFEFIVSARWGLLPPAIVAFSRGARHTYEVFDWVWVAVSVLVVLRIGPRYWGHTS